MNTKRVVEVIKEISELIGVLMETSMHLFFWLFALIVLGKFLIHTAVGK